MSNSSETIPVLTDGMTLVELCMDAIKNPEGGGPLDAPTPTYFPVRLLVLPCYQALVLDGPFVRGAEVVGGGLVHGNCSARAAAWYAAKNYGNLVDRRSVVVVHNWMCFPLTKQGSLLNPYVSKHTHDTVALLLPGSSHTFILGRLSELEHDPALIYGQERISR